ncbi:hypothetical protein ACPPVS_16785 [Cellulomonas sp. McL0617]|uniref:hypothetical protein n=1 Tax=Cellulomonas sp. McL0617 TaxID=3415675 RepID=UPI003CEAA083
MTTTTVPAVRRGPVDLTARWYLAAQLRVARWFWGIGALVAAVAIAFYATVATTVDTSVVQYGMQAAIWFPFSVFIGLTLAYLPVHVASGLTRRTLARGSLLAAAGTTGVYGGAFAVLLLVEKAVYAAFGWHWAVGGVAPGAVATAGYIGANVATFLVSNVSGLLVGMIYLRLGGWWGTLTLPVTVGPVVALTALLAQDAGPWGDGAGGLLLTSVLALVVAAVMAVVYDRLTRGARVPPKR